MFAKQNLGEKYVQVAHHPNLKSMRSRLLAGVSTVILCVAVFFVAVNIKNSSDGSMAFKLRQTGATDISSSSSFDASSLRRAKTALSKPGSSAARKLTGIDTDKAHKGADTPGLKKKASKSASASGKKVSKQGDTGHTKHGKASQQKITAGNKKLSTSRVGKQFKKSSRDHHHRTKFITSSTIHNATNSSGTQAKASALSGAMHQGPDGHGHEDGFESRIRFFWSGGNSAATAATAAAPADGPKAASKQGDDSKVKSAVSDGKPHQDDGVKPQAEQKGDGKVKPAMSGPMGDGPDGHGHVMESRIRFFWGGGNNSTSGGNNSTSGGNNSTSGGNNSTSGGNNSTSGGNYSPSSGNNSTSSDDNSTSSDYTSTSQ
jgi:hypothetical protein